MRTLIVTVSVGYLMLFVMAEAGRTKNDVPCDFLVIDKHPDYMSGRTYYKAPPGNLMSIEKIFPNAPEALKKTEGLARLELERQERDMVIWNAGYLTVEEQITGKVFDIRVSWQEYDRVTRCGCYVLKKFTAM